MKKIILTVIDGLGDRPVPQLKNRTPLEAASTPNLNKLTERGVCGLLEPVFTTAIPTSEEGHFALFGYDPEKYHIQRGLFTAKAAGIELKEGDVAFRGNFSTVKDNLEIVDRRAGRIKETSSLIESLRGMEIDGVRFLIESAEDYRVGVVLRGGNLSSNVSNGDPHYSSLGKKAKEIKPEDDTFEAKFTAKVLNKFLKESRKILKNHALNQKRKKKGLLPANYILLREPASLQEIPGFKEKYGLKACCIAGKFLYQQIAETLGMKVIKVKGATGCSDTNLKGKFKTVKEALKEYDFVFLHIKATDSLAEDGKFKEKKDFIEKIDKNFRSFLDLRNVLIVVTADHSTCCDVKRHCKEPIPLLISSSEIEPDDVKKFSEKNCKEGKLGKIKQTELMSKILNVAKKKVA